MCFSIVIVNDLRRYSLNFQAEVLREAFAKHERLAEQDPKKYRSIEMNTRIFPGYFAPVIVWENGRRIVRPMRYRIRPSWASEELPSKYSLYNARLDALETRRTWRPLFMKKHGLVAFKSFYEWVADKDRQGKKRLLNFSPEDKDLMWAPCLWDKADEKANELLSFAIITTDPPPEIGMMGHDRCPIFLKKDLIDVWLQPEKFSKERIYEALHSLEPTFYKWREAA